MTDTAVEPTTTTDTIDVRSEFEQLPDELKNLYHLIYDKIHSMLTGRNLDLKSDLTFVRLMIENAMEAVEKFKDGNGQGWTGPEKKEYALLLVTYIIRDLRTEGKIDDELADALEMAIGFFGSEIIDLVFDALNELFDIGQEIVDDIAANGCLGCARRNC